MALKGKKPEAKEKRLKLFMYAPAGIGKTTAAIQFPNSYIIDTEKGTDQYSNTISKMNSVVFQSSNPDEIRIELKALLQESHDFKTLVIDPSTKLYESVQEKWTRIFERYAKSEKEKEIQDFGMRYWQRVKAEYKSIQRLILALDMNVIVTAHQKDMYGAGMSKIGTTFDSMKGDDYFFDFIFQLDVVNGKRMAITKKERADIGANKFPETFEWSYQNFQKYYGSEILERPAQTLKMATDEQVLEITKLLSTVKIDEDWQDKVFQKADVEKWDELDYETIQKCIDFLKNKIKI